MITVEKHRTQASENCRWAVSFWLLNALLTAVIALRYWHWLHIPQGNILATVYLVVTQIGLFGLFSLLLLTVTLLFSPFPKGIFRGLNVAVALLTGMLLIIDTLVFDQYRFHINRFVVELFFEGGDSINFSWFTWLVAAGVMLTLLALLIGLGYLAARKGFSARAKGAGIFVVVGCLLLSQGIHAWEEANYRMTIPSFSPVFPLYYPLTANSRLVQWGLIDPEQANRRESTLDDEPRGNFHYPLTPIHHTRVQTPPNILFIMTDAWRFDDANARVTPNVWAFSRQALRFKQHRSGGNSTQAGIFSLFYSVPATYFNDASNSGRRPAFMQVLDEQGYQFSVHGSAPLNHPPFDRTVFSRIKDLQVVTPGDNPARRDRNITSAFERFLQQRDKNRPFFGFLFYDSAHGYAVTPDMPTPFQPYWQRVDHIKLNNAFDPLPYHNRYRNALHYVDSLIGEALGELRHQGLEQNTIVVITTDHGEEFNDNRQNYWGHGSNYSDAQIHVPLFIRWPGKAPQTIAYRTTHLDIIPTLMQQALGVTTPEHDYSVGGSLFTPGLGDQDYIAGSYYDYAVVGPDEIDVVYPDGRQVTTTRDLAPQAVRQLKGERLQRMIEEMSRFYQ